MSWLRRILRLASEETGSDEPSEPRSEPITRSSPGVAAFFAGLREDRSHAVLDFGSASEANLRLYGQFARWVRFAELLPDPPHGEAWAEALENLPSAPGQPYDLVLLWNVLDTLEPLERPPLIERLSRITAPGARLYVLVGVSGERARSPLRFTLRTVSQVSQEVVGPPLPPRPPLLPAEVERLLVPFQVAHAFTLRGGWREYVAHWKGQDPKATTWWTR